MWKEKASEHQVIWREANWKKEITEEVAFWASEAGMWGMVESASAKLSGGANKVKSDKVTMETAPWLLRKGKQKGK